MQLVLLLKNASKASFPKHRLSFVLILGDEFYEVELFNEILFYIQLIAKKTDFEKLFNRFR